MWVCETKACVTRRSSRADNAVTSPRSNSSARRPKRKSMNSAGSEKGSLTSRGCTSQVMSSPFSFDRRKHAAGCGIVRAKGLGEGTLYTLFDGRADAENAAAAPRGYFVYIRRSPSSFRTPLAGLGKFDDSLGDLYASRLSHAAAAIGHVHGTNDVDAAFAVRPTFRSAECLTECSAAPRADDPSGRPQPGKPTANVITATTSAPKPKRSNLHRSSRA